MLSQLFIVVFGRRVKLKLFQIKFNILNQGGTMKFYSTFLLALFSLILFSCEKTDTSVTITENTDNIISISSKPTIIPTQNGFAILQLIDGSKGGSITFDTVYVDSEGDSIKIQTNLMFLPKSFIGVKEIKIIPDLSTGSVQFFPEMIFDKPAYLDLSYAGVDLVKLGFDSNSKIDFVYRADDGSIEYILNNECKIKWNTQTLYLKNAKIPHFSRYIFVRKSL